MGVRGRTDADDGVSGVAAAAADERDVVVFRGRINGINLSGSFGFGAALPHTPFPSSSTPSFSGRQFPAVQLPLTAPLPRPAPRRLLARAETLDVLQRRVGVGMG